MNEFLKRHAPAKIRQVKQKSFYHDEKNRSFLERELYMKPGESRTISLRTLWDMYHAQREWEIKEATRFNF
jgi:hypothetical protein